MPIKRMTNDKLEDEESEDDEEAARELDKMAQRIVIR